jgi:arabinofuranosyltransferase
MFKADSVLLGVSSVVITAIGTALAFVWLGGVPIIGIDDANITQVYASNIAAGNGFVYNVGGEEVEGATSLLWTILNTIAFRFSNRPELVILVLSFCLTSLSIAGTLNLGLRLGRHFELSNRWGLAAMSVYLTGLVPFYAWSALTLMDLALWCAVLIWFVERLTAFFDSPDNYPSMALSILAIALVATRPEGIAVALGLCIVVSVLARLTLPGKPSLRPIVWAAASALVAFGVLTAWCIHVFGYPFPNTFYAKTSTDIWPQLKQGVAYLERFLGDFGGAAVYLAGWMVLFSIALTRDSKDRNSGGIILAQAVVALSTLGGVLLLYVVLGGDHFSYYRFFQPIVPLLGIPLWIGIAIELQRASDRYRAVAGVAFAGIAACYFAVSFSEFIEGGSVRARDRANLHYEWVVAVTGRDFGDALSHLRSHPSVGVVPAGGVKRAYSGKVYDLMGLNWTEMAHRDSRKQGTRGHASFSEAVFWETPIDLVYYGSDACLAKQIDLRRNLFFVVALHGMPSGKRFRAEFLPARLGCFYVFIRRAYAATHPGEFELLPWSDVLTDETQVAGGLS